MNNTAVIAKVENIRTHPNADKLNIATVMGSQVIVSKDVIESTLGVFFGDGLQLSFEFAKTNGLAPYIDSSGIKKQSYIGDNLRVRTQKIRGERSEGLWLSLNSLLPFLVDTTLDQLTEGTEFNTIDSTLICQKFIPEHLKRKIANQEKNKKKKETSEESIIKYFPKHKDTEHFVKMKKFIPDNSVIYITEKLHGTSARFGKINVAKPYLTIGQKLLRLLGIKAKAKNYKVSEEFTIGSRNKELEKIEDTSYYTDGEKFRFFSVQGVKDKVQSNEIFYGEIVGYTETGKPIMSPHTITSKEIKELEHLSDNGKSRYLSNMIYSYGCNPGTFKLYIYRIVRTLDNQSIELNWEQVKDRCNYLGLNYVPELAGPLIWNKDTKESICKLVETLDEGPSTIDPTHIREGVVIRIDKVGTTFMKHKSFTFKALEGIVSLKETFEDLEDIS